MKIKDGQTLLDVAIQEFGSWEAMTDIAILNNLTMTDIPEAGTNLSTPDKVYDETMQAYCRNNDISPATARDSSGISLRIFTDEFEKQFV